MRFLRWLSEQWDTMSRREQRLALAVGSLLLVCFAMFVYNRAVGRLRQLDAELDRLHETILNYHRQILFKEQIEEEYGKVAALHSSAWTAAEIRDRLRQEIYRLAELEPPPLDENGIPVTVRSGSGKLVEIPTLGEGGLEEGGEGFRLYRQSVKIPLTHFKNVVDYLERLQSSPQSLRIDGLELHRDYLGYKVSAEIDIARIIVDGTGQAESGQDQPASVLEALGQRSADWANRGCAVSGEGTIMAVADKDQAFLCLPVRLYGGETYDLFVVIEARGSAELRIRDENSGTFLEGAVPIEKEERPYEYHVQFTVPGPPGSLAPLKAPFILLPKAGSEVAVSSVLLEKATV